MITVTDEVLERMVEAIVREVDPEEIWLFGSRARGEAREHSDVDLLVIEREPFTEGKKRWQHLSRLYDLAAERRLPVDILLYSQDEANRWGGHAGHILGTVLHDGRRIYERPRRSPAHAPPGAE